MTITAAWEYWTPCPEVEEALAYTLARLWRCRRHRRPGWWREPDYSPVVRYECRRCRRLFVPWPGKEWQRYCSRACTPNPSGGHGEAEIDPAGFAALWSSGQSVRLIAVRLGVSPGTVSNTARRLGLPPRRGQS